jgi:dihydrofolate reductase
MALREKVLVLTSRDLIIPPGLAGKVEALHLPSGKLLSDLESRGASHIYLDGGNTIQRFLHEGLVDGITITIIPILIGEGLPLFGPLGRDIKLELVESKAFKNGFVQSRYRIYHAD